jgi:hypothetical protein
MLFLKFILTSEWSLGSEHPHLLFMGTILSSRVENEVCVPQCKALTRMMIRGKENIKQMEPKYKHGTDAAER